MSGYKSYTILLIKIFSNVFTTNTGSAAPALF